MYECAKLTGQPRLIDTSKYMVGIQQSKTNERRQAIDERTIPAATAINKNNDLKL